MRAFFVDYLDKSQTEVEILGDDVHHYVHVLRGDIGEHVLVINGKGLVLKGIVESIKKKRAITVKVCSYSIEKRKTNFELALGVTKREYLTETLRMATESGVAKLHLIVMEKTPWKYLWTDRFEKVVRSAMTQSNNFFRPEIIEYKSLRDFLDKNNESTMAFITEEVGSDDDDCICGTVLIGPEGGYCEGEIELLKACDNIKLARLPNPIMRSVTASAFVLGFIQGKQSV